MSGVVRARRIINSSAAAATSRPLAVYHIAVAFLHRHGLDLRRIGAGARLGDAHRLQPQLARGYLGKVFLLCAGACRRSVFMLYIWPWQEPALPPERDTSSMITVASVSERPEPYLLGDERRHPSGLR